MGKLLKKLKYLQKKPIIWMFGNKKKYKDINLQNVKSILIKSNGDALGDTLMALSYARQLKNVYKNIKIGITVTNRNNELVQIAYENENIINEIIGRNKKAALENRGKWDVLLDFTNKINTNSLVWTKFLKAKIVIIFGEKDDNHYFNKKNINNYDFDCTPPIEVHTIDYLLHSEFTKYFKFEKQKPYLKIADTEIESVEKVWKMPENDKRIKILLSPQGSDREIPVHEIANFLNKLDKNISKKIKIVMGNTAGSEEYFEKLTSLINKNLNLDIMLCEKLSIREYLAFVATSELVIGVDGGSCHIACAFKKPLLSFYANNEFNLYKWSPVPYENIDTFRVVSNENRENIMSKDTYNFPLKEASSWLKNQIDNLYSDKINI